MATGRKTVVVGQVIDPVAWGNPLWDQSVQQFASDADRTAQFPAAQRRPGVVTWRDDAQVLEVWDGTAWRTVHGGAWTPYTPAWLAGGVPVVPGTNGVVTGRYLRIGRTVDVKVLSSTGAGFNGGSGAWTWSLPAGVGAPVDYFPATGWLNAPGGGVPRAVIAGQVALGATVIDLAVAGPGNGLVGGFSLPPGSLLLWQARYEVP